MEDYNFWADLFDTYQSLPDWIKALWLIVPPAFLLGLFALVMLYRLVSKEVDKAVAGELLYTVYKEPAGLFQIYRHGVLDDGNPELVLLERRLAKDPQRLG